MLSEKEMLVVGLIEENREEIVDYLRKFISFRTVSPSQSNKIERDEHKRLQNFVCKTLEEMGFALDVWEIDTSKLKSFPGSGVDPDRNLSGMPVVVGKLKGGGRGKSLILNGHYDVVPAGIVGNWSHDPFEGEIEDNKIFGRGACDMKAGIVAMLKAVKFIQRAGIKINGDLTMEIVPDEEGSSMGTLSCCERGYKADAAVIPEPTNMNVLVAVRGNLSGAITVFGRAGHADITQPHWKEGGAVNAMVKAVKVIRALEELTKEWRNRPDMAHKFLDPAIVTPTIIRGGEWLITHPEEVQIGFSSDFSPGMVSKIRQEIEEKIMSVAASDPWMKEHPPKLEAGWLHGAEIDENEPIVETAMEAARELGIEPKLVGWGTLTDAVHLVNCLKIPTISIGPDDKTAHATDEFVDIEQLVKTTKVLALAVLRWCGYA